MGRGARVYKHRSSHHGTTVAGVRKLALHRRKWETPCRPLTPRVIESRPARAFFSAPKAFFWRQVRPDVVAHTEWCGLWEGRIIPRVSDQKNRVRVRVDCPSSTW